jgi:hypothetical protein
MNWKGCGRKQSRPNFEELFQHFTGRTEKNTKNLSQDSRFPGRDLNPVPPEYEAAVLITS